MYSATCVFNQSSYLHNSILDINYLDSLSQINPQPTAYIRLIWKHAIKYNFNFQRTLEGEDFSNDLQQIQEQLRKHRQVHQDVTTFRSQVDKCINDMVRPISLFTAH